MTTRTLKDARQNFDELLDVAEKDVVQVRRNRKPIAALMPWNEFESLMETLEILSDPEAKTAIQESEEDYKAGRVVNLTEFEKRHSINEFYSAERQTIGNA